MVTIATNQTKKVGESALKRRSYLQMRARNARIMYLLLLTTFKVNFAGLGN